MKIRTEIKIVAIVVLVVIVLALGTVGYYFAESRRQVSEMNTAGETITAVTRLRFSAIETLLYGGKRPQAQWARTYDFLEELLDKEKYKSQRETEIVWRIKINLSALNVLYEKLSTQLSQSNPVSSQVRQDATARTSSEILLVSQGMLDSANELYKINLGQTALYQRLGSLLLLILVIVSALVSFWLLVMVNKRVLKPLIVVQAGMQKIASGNLAHRFQMPYKNEIGQLGRAFDHMTAQLQDSYGQLEGENALRRAAQDEMQMTLGALAQARDQADAANIAKGAFLANMSHEIRTPMNAVLGMLQLVQKTALDVRQQDYVGKAQSAAKSLLSLLNDILDFSKMDADKLQLDLHPFDLDGLMRDLAVVLSGAQSDTDVEIIFEIDPELPLVLRGDRLRFQQILINLAGNAVKFTQAGQVVICLTQMALGAGKLTLRVEISDTGIGMSPDQLARIFDGFTQAEASTTRRFGGTGLGLVISQRLVALMGGSLQVQSALGKGSRFWFDIVLPVEATHVAVVPTAFAQGLRILVVDDNPLSREILVKTLQGIGWSADSASGGHEGVDGVRRAEAQADPYDVVLMDWRMPGMDGLAAASLIRQALPGSLPPVIIMVTAFGREVLAETTELPNAPFVDFLTKPVTPHQLATAIQNALAGPVSQPASASPVPVLRLQGTRILLVEDNAMNRQVATELLCAEGAQVAVAQGGLEGVSMATQPDAAFDVVIMDVQMPDLDGLEATRRIRANADARQPPILAMTANASAADRRDCLAAGMNDHIAKPIDIDEVVARLLTLLGRALKDGPALALPPSTAQSNPDGLVESPQAILRRFGQKIDVYRMTLSSFKADGVRLLAQLQQQVHNDDLVQAGATMHAIRGMAATLGAAALAKVASDLERRARTEPGATVDSVFSTQTLAVLTDLLDRSDVALAAAMLPQGSEGADTTTTATAIAPVPGRAALTPEQQVARLLEIQALLRAGNLRAIDLTQELLDLSSGEDKLKVQELRDIANQLQFADAERATQSLLKGLR